MIFDTKSKRFVHSTKGRPSKRSLTPQVSIGHTEAGIDLGQRALNMGAGMVF